MNTTKIINVALTDLQDGDVIVATGLAAAEGEGINYKALPEPIDLTAGVVTRTTRTREFIALHGAERGFRAGTSYRVRRAMTEEELAEAKTSNAHAAADDVRREIQDPMRRLIAARDKLINALQTTYANDPARCLASYSDDVANTQARTSCWCTVARIAAHLHNKAVEDGEAVAVRRAEDSSDEMILKAVLLTLRGVEAELLRGDYARSTNPYSNAVEDDQRKGSADWRRDYVVLHAVTAAKSLGITVEDDE